MFTQMIHFKVRLDFYVLIVYCRKHNHLKNKSSGCDDTKTLKSVLDEIHFEWFKDTVRVLKFRPKSVLFLKWPENRTDTFGVVSLIVNIKY